RGRSTSPLRRKTLSMGVPARRASATALRPSMIPSALAPSWGRFGRGRGYVSFMKTPIPAWAAAAAGPRTAGRNYRGNGQKICTFYVLYHGSQGRKSPFPLEFLGKPGGRFAGFHNFLTPKSQGVSCIAGGNMIPYFCQVRGVSPNRE